MKTAYQRRYDFSQPLDDNWEMIPEKGWTFEMSPGRARFVNTTAGHAEIYLRPCSGYGDSFEFKFAPGAKKTGQFVAGFIAGFEFIRLVIDLDRSEYNIVTHEFHKDQPRNAGLLPTAFTRLTVRREKDRLPGLPYEGSIVTILADGTIVAQVRHIDYLPESLFMFGLWGQGEVTLNSFAIRGPARPRPEYVNIGIWQQAIKPKTRQNVDALIAGVRQAAAAGVEILVTPETALTGLRPADPELADRAAIQAELKRFQKIIKGIRNAPYTLVGYPEWISGSQVDGATAKKVKINCHRFVRPNGALGPLMAKVHSCEDGLWHGRNYNFQRVAGVETVLGVCHDGHYQDVWATSVMGGARVCLHAAAGGMASGPIPALLQGMRGLGTGLDCYWIRVNAGGPSAIIYPTTNRKHPDTILAVPADLTEKSPTYPNYSSMGDLLAHARIRLWDATGSYPLRTLRSGKERYKLWSRLIPKIRNV